MHGIKAYLVFGGFLFVAAMFLVALVREWANRARSTTKLIGISVFVLLWFTSFVSVFARRAYFLHELADLNASDVYEVRIGRHDFRDAAAIGDITRALRDSRWFEVNHGGWGDSIPLTLSRGTKPDLVIDVALYFREPAAVAGPARRRGLGYSPTVVFVPDLPRVLKGHGVELPTCDSPHGRPCTQAQLNP